MTQENLAELDDVQYRDYKRAMMRRTREAHASGQQSQIGSMFLCCLLIVAAGLVVLHNYGFLDTVKITP